jgi:hypothetical protein
MAVGIFVGLRLVALADKAPEQEKSGAERHDSKERVDLLKSTCQKVRNVRRGVWKEQTTSVGAVVSLPQGPHHNALDSFRDLKDGLVRDKLLSKFMMESLILAQGKRWRRA